MEQKALNNQTHVLKLSTRFDSYELALTQRDSERASIESGKSPYSKAKVVRRGPHNTTQGEYFELKLYTLKNPPKPEQPKKDTKKKNKKSKKPN
jgi:hypothetical protein